MFNVIQDQWQRTYHIILSYWFCYKRINKITKNIYGSPVEIESLTYIWTNGNLLNVSSLYIYFPVPKTYNASFFLQWLCKFVCWLWLTLNVNIFYLMYFSTSDYKASWNNLCLKTKKRRVGGGKIKVEKKWKYGIKIHKSYARLLYSNVCLLLFLCVYVCMFAERGFCCLVK